MSLATNWVDNIGMFVNAAYLNALDTLVNANTKGLPQIGTITSSATPAINTDVVTQFTITAQAVPITSMSSGLSGTPGDGQRIIIRIKDNGSSQTIAWGASWRGVGVTLPTNTIPTGVLYIEAHYNAAASLWDVVNVRKQLVPVSIIGTNIAAATSVTIPTHQAGDDIYLFAFNNNTGTQCVKPAAAGTVPAWVDIEPAAGTSTCTGYLTHFVATANNHTSGAWTNATDMVAVVVRGVNPSAPVGGHAKASGSSTTSATAPAATQTKTDGTSVLLHFFGHRVVSAWAAAPAGYTQLGASGAVCVDSKTDTTSDGAVVQNCTATSGGTDCATVEILAAT